MSNYRKQASSDTQRGGGQRNSKSRGMGGGESAELTFLEPYTLLAILNIHWPWG